MSYYVQLEQNATTENIEARTNRDRKSLNVFFSSSKSIGYMCVTFTSRDDSKAAGNKQDQENPKGKSEIVEKKLILWIDFILY